MREAGFLALCAGADLLAVPSSRVATARMPGAVGGGLCQAYFPASCAGGGLFAVPGFAAATAQAPGAVGRGMLEAGFGTLCARPGLLPYEKCQIRERKLLG